MHGNVTYTVDDVTGENVDENKWVRQGARRTGVCNPAARRFQYRMEIANVCSRARVRVICALGLPRRYSFGGIFNRGERERYVSNTLLSA